VFILPPDIFRNYKVRIRILFLFALLTYTPLSIAQISLKQRITIDIEDKSIEEAITILQNQARVPFSYSKSLIRLDQKISKNYRNLTLEEILDDFFNNTDVMYSLKSGVIVLQPRPQNLDKLFLTGTVRNFEDGSPIEFAGVGLLNSGKWAYTNLNGKFVFQVRKSNFNDSIEISCLGFEKACFLASGFLENSQHVVYMKQSTVNLQTVNVNANDYKIRTVGNHSIFSFGSIYIDTQGQQTALFITSKKGRRGFIESVSFFLSDKGNVESPFRVRIYDRDSLLSCPGNDLVNEIIIARPNKAGWFEVDLSSLNLEIPSEGFFVAIEGIYPVNMIEKTDNQEENESPITISYGQRLGYNRKNGEYTWHYSLGHKWFQLKEDNFHVMISAEIQYRKKRKKEGY